MLDRLAIAAQARLSAALHAPQAAREDSSSSEEQACVRDAYLAWLERYRQIEGESSAAPSQEHQQKAFAEQVGYVYFVRLLLARVLEDKGLIARETFQPYAIRLNNGETHECGDVACLRRRSTTQASGVATFMGVLLIHQHIVSFEKHFFTRPVFDWFQPDSSLLDQVLRCLDHYNFKDISNDLLGFTYEAFIERTARRQKGHFLTPPDVVEFMLDRAGYTSPDIISKKLLDPACGSGSFLVHAARRLRSEIQASMASKSELERARTFIEQVQTKLVGLEINPFSCYLAELNLFIQLLDDLAFLWSHGEHPNIERFSIYNTNSLEMPLAVLQSEYKTIATTAFHDEATALDEAALIKATPQTFTYIICNPPYVNRGIILSAKRYSNYPFYRAVVKGDENFYLLFLRLATYYCAPGGTICFICPLNLFGDESTTRAREMFNHMEDWSLSSITRFYTRTVLFRGVLQGVCVIRIDRQPARATSTVEIRGGFTLQEAEQSSAHIPYMQVIANYPTKNTWNKPWLINANPQVYALWEYIRQRENQDLAELIADKLDTVKGDVRSTWTKALRFPTAGPRTVPMTKGEKIVDWGDWSAAAYVDPSITISPTVDNYTSSLWVQKNIQRITGLTQVETALFLKEVSGLEMKRPVRGTIIQRSAKQPVVADETALVMYTRDPAHEELAYAVFGLITSSLYNFLFSLFSTNAHANFKEILRLPVPTWTGELEKRLATTTREVLRVYGELYEHEKKYGLNQGQQINPMEQKTQERAYKRSQVVSYQQLLDEQIMEAYGITQPAWKNLVNAGVPWARN